MKITVRRVLEDYDKWGADVEVTDGCTKIDLGLLDKKRRKELIDHLKETIESLED